MVIEKKYKVVTGKDSLDRRPRRYMERTEGGAVTYHRYKVKTRRLGKVYGHCGTVKHEAVESTTYKVFKEPVELSWIKDVYTVKDLRDVVFGY